MANKAGVSQKLDVIIIGAGASGLAAAEALHEAKIPFVILEARPRIGGRAHTQSVSPTIEMGPEFIHGTAIEVRKRLHKYGISSYDVPELHDTWQNGRFEEEENLWEELSEILKKVPKLSHDESIDEALDRTKIAEDDRKFAKSFFAGFDTVRVKDASARELIESQKAFDDPKEQAVGKPLTGYTALIERMAAPFRAKIRLNHAVKTIEWSKDSVTVTCLAKKGRGQVLRAKKLLVTTSIGVLKSGPSEPGHLQFLPPLYEKSEALAGLGMGPVHKVVLEFTEDFWSEKFPHPVSMIHTPNLHFQTWWNSAPMRWPVFTAWSGGDQADRLSGMSDAGIREQAILDFAKLTKTPLAQVRKKLVKTHFHNWCSDPHSLGAYAYIKTSGIGSREALAKPLAQTIYFAGEALNVERSGTMDGAVQTGIRAASLMIRALKR